MEALCSALCTARVHESWGGCWINSVVTSVAAL